MVKFLDSFFLCHRLLLTRADFINLIKKLFIAHNFFSYFFLIILKAFFVTEFLRIHNDRRWLISDPFAKSWSLLSHYIGRRVARFISCLHDDFWVPRRSLLVKLWNFLFFHFLEFSLRLDVFLQLVKQDDGLLTLPVVGTLFFFTCYVIPEDKTFN